MPSTRKQKANEKRSRRLDGMFDNIEKTDVMWVVFQYKNWRVTLMIKIMKWTLSPVDLGKRWFKIARTSDHHDNDY